MRRLATLPIVGLLLVSGMTACRDDTVRLTFRPKIGDVYRYEVKVRSRSEVRLPGQKPQVTSEDIVLQSEQTVLDAGKDGVRVQIILGDAAGSVRTFVVRFDRAAQLESIESDDAITDEEAGVIGISEIFPAAAGAPPVARLQPGEHWSIDDDVSVPGSIGAARLTGEGRLVELGVQDGAEIAKLATSSRLRLTSAQETAQGETVHLAGEQVTEQRASHDLSDGAVREASSTTAGTFDLEIGAPFGQLRDAIHGTLTVRVTSRTRRLD